MLLNSFVLALSSSIDSLGIGITYGIKDTHISSSAKIVLFVISFTISALSLWFGDMLKSIFSDFWLGFARKFNFNWNGTFCMFPSHSKKSLKF